jgi:hypothetical protein
MEKIPKLLKMRKEILVLLMLVGIIGNATAICNLNIESDLNIVGNGTIDRNLDVQTEWKYKDQRLSETMYSSRKTIDDVSNINFDNDFNLYIRSDYTEIGYRQTAFTTNIYHEFFGQNYDAGIMTGFKTIGEKSTKSFEIEMTPDSNYLALEGTMQGKTTLKHVVVDPSSRLKVVNDITRLKGSFGIDWFVLSRKLTGINNEDWLGCP